MIKDAIEDAESLDRTESSIDLYLDGWRSLEERKGGVMTEPTLEQVIENQQNVIELWAKKYAELEQQLAEAKARIAELKIKEFMYDEHSDAVKKCLALNKQLVATEKALRWVCDVYIVDDYYSDDLRKEQLERSVRRVMVKVTGGE